MIGRPDAVPHGNEEKDEHHEPFHVFLPGVFPPLQLSPTKKYSPWGIHLADGTAYVLYVAMAAGLMGRDDKVLLLIPLPKGKTFNQRQPRTAKPANGILHGGKTMPKEEMNPSCGFVTTRGL